MFPSVTGCSVISTQPPSHFAQKLIPSPWTTLLGEKAMRKWVSLVSVAAPGNSVADGLLRLPLLRATFCELIGLKN